MQYEVWSKGRSLGTFESNSHRDEKGQFTGEFARAALNFCATNGIQASTPAEIRPVVPETASGSETTHYTAQVNGETFTAPASTAKEAKAALVALLNQKGTYAEYLRWVMDGKKVRRS